MNRGIAYALSAYIFWGLHPIYWKLLQNVPSVEIVSHRIIWSFVFFVIIISFRKEWKGLTKKIKESDNKPILFIPALLIGSNWALYIWAVNAGFIIETSLGYFICPLITVFLGVVFLHESLRRIQWIAVLIAGIGVLVMTFIYGQFPWISLYLAGTWGTYGLLRKKSPLNSVEGLTLETTLLSVPAIIYLAYLTMSNTGSFTTDLPTSLLLIGSGITSGLPLLVFIIGARMINLSLIGILQYIYPTLIFIVGAYIYGEPLSEAKMIGFMFIWSALIIYTVDGTFFLKRRKVCITGD
ncbi:MAG: EamA family transporter RarD [Ignavibacteriaceae bacterium]|jgi:chloramphenicol-sensitive protein RarD